MNKDGISFSKEKLNEVLHITYPPNASGLRSFLGLVGYFRDNIRDHATLTTPLYNMLTDFEKHRKFEWTSPTIKAFDDIKQAVQNLPLLFYLDEESPVFVHTDASDYGIGAYCFQVKEGVERPIAFMSKMLSAQEIAWTTIEKECYALVYALRKFEYLLRDRPFTLRTDHANLKYINDPPSPKVRRWKLAIQEYDFHLEHIKGELNIVADAFSRLLSIDEDNLCLMEEYVIPKDKYDIISRYHNKVVGHHGVDRTLQILRLHGHNWEYMRDHVK
jgi:hypothetical protein